MFTPPAFAEDDAESISAMIARSPLAVLATVDAAGEIVASHLPMLFNPQARTFIGHLARANPQTAARPARGRVIIQGPNAYVSPGFYPSKQEHGRVVPTWNYEAVHASGALEWIDEPNALLSIVTALSDRFEAGDPEPWRVSDAPAEFTAAMLAGIIGVRMRIETLEAKRKLSQNRPQADRIGVIAGLSASAAPGDLTVAELMRGLEA